MSVSISRRDFLRLSGGVTAGTALAGLSGMGLDLGPTTVKAAEARIKGAKAIPSVCPYCAVGCGLLAYTVEENGRSRIIDIEGDPQSPISQGTLCPKGSATYQLHV